MTVLERLFLSTPSARRATSTRSRTTRRPTISIHALREEGDLDDSAIGKVCKDFYPRPPRGGRRALCAVLPAAIQFLSTPSARRATRSVSYRVSPSGYFYPRPPRGGRQVAGGALCPALKISIHALREEGDERRLLFLLLDAYFYPRPPRGGRLVGCPTGRSPRRFLSTPSARRATRCVRLQDYQLGGDFYPRPPRGGRPRTHGTTQSEKTDFYPRPPRGGRRDFALAVVTTSQFLSTPSARRATSSRRP